MSWFKNPFSTKVAIAGIFDTVVSRFLEYEFRIYSGCDQERPYYALKLVKRPPIIDLDGDGIPDKP